MNPIKPVAKVGAPPDKSRASREAAAEARAKQLAKHAPGEVIEKLKV